MNRYAMVLGAAVSVIAVARAAESDPTRVGQIAVRTDRNYTRVQLLDNTVDFGCTGSSAYVLIERDADSGQGVDTSVHDTILSTILTAKSLESDIVVLTSGCANFNSSDHGVVRTLYQQ